MKNSLLAQTKNEIKLRYRAKIKNKGLLLARLLSELFSTIDQMPHLDELFQFFEIIGIQSKQTADILLSLQLECSPKFEEQVFQFFEEEERQPSTDIYFFRTKTLLAGLIQVSLKTGRKKVNLTDTSERAKNYFKHGIRSSAETILKTRVRDQENLISGRSSMANIKYDRHRIVNFLGKLDKLIRYQIKILKDPKSKSMNDWKKEAQVLKEITLKCPSVLSPAKRFKIYSDIVEWRVKLDVEHWPNSIRSKIRFSPAIIKKLINDM